MFVEQPLALPGSAKKLITSRSHAMKFIFVDIELLSILLFLSVSLIPKVRQIKQFLNLLLAPTSNLGVVSLSEPENPGVEERHQNHESPDTHVEEETFWAGQGTPQFHAKVGG